MSNNDIETLVYFITRTPMYVEESSALAIKSFITGYEIGKTNLFFTENLSSILEKHYSSPKGALGWSGQIEVLVKKEKKHWTSVFKKVTLNALIKISEDSLKSKLQMFLKERLVLNIERIAPIHISGSENTINYFDKNWIIDWFGFVDLEEAWFKEIWTKKELVIIKNINQEVEKIKLQEEEIAPNKYLLELSSKFKISKV